MTTTHGIPVEVPSIDQLEDAWWKCMGGEFGIEHDPGTRGFVQTMVDHVRREAETGVPIMSADGEPLEKLTAEEFAKRICDAYADLFYGRG